MQEEESTAAHLQLLLRVDEHVQQRRQAYAARSADEQRRHGPCLLEQLLTSVVEDLLPTLSQDGGDVTAGLPFATRDVPTLAHVAALQTRLTTTVMAAITTRAIVTVFELEEWVCALEGVERFAELGLGVGLQVLPVVQQYFQLRANSIVFPVRAHDVLTFVLSDAGARDVLLYGGGDARDLLNRFAVFYDRHVLRDADAAAVSTTAGAGHSRGAERLQAVRQLGIHVQDYAALLASLSQEAASAHRREQQRWHTWLVGDAGRDGVSEERGSDAGGRAAVAATAAAAAIEDAAAADVVPRRARNAVLYERVLLSLDAACAAEDLAEGLRRTRERTCARAPAEAAAPTASTATAAGARSITFTVAVPEAEARSYSLPLSLWCPAPLCRHPSSSVSGGGVELHFCVGAAPSATRHAELAPLATQQPVAPPLTPPAASAATDSPAASPVAAGASALRRHRRGPVVDPPASVAAAPAAASLLAALMAPAGSLGLASPPGQLQSAVAAAPAHLETAPAPSPAEEVPTVLETLRAVLSDLSDAAADVAASLSAEDGCLGARQGSRDALLERAVDALAALAPGDVLPVSLLCDVYAACGACAAAGDAAAGATRARTFADRRCIALFRPDAAAGEGSCGGAAHGGLAALRRHGGGGHQPATVVAAVSTAAVREIVCMATPAEVSWTAWWTPTQPDAHHPRTTALLNCASLERHYPESLRGVLCGLFGVRPAPTVAAWCTTAATCARRLCPAWMLTQSFTEAYMEAFTQCVDADVAARVADMASERAAGSAAGSPLPFVELQQETAKLALRRVLAGVQAALAAAAVDSPSLAGLFPCDHAWRCGHDGLLYATPRWCNFDGALLTSPSPAPPLRVLCFHVQEPSWAACAVLQAMHVRPLSQLAGTRVTFSTTVATDASALLHCKVAAITPYVQALCRASLPLWYGVAYTTLLERLQHFRVVLTSTAGSSAQLRSASPVQALQLHLHGHVYTHLRSISLEYVAAHNILYGVAASASAPALADALLSLFMPVGTAAPAEARRLTSFIADLLGALSSLDGAEAWADGVADTAPAQQQRRREQEREVLRPVAARYGVLRLDEQPHDDTAAVAEVAFTLPSPAFARFHHHFPPGTDALRQPRGPPSAAGVAPPRHALGTHTLTRATAAALVGLADGAAVSETSRTRPGWSNRGGGGGGLVHRVGADGRLHMTVPLAGSGGGGGMAVVTATPTWADLPWELDVDAVVAASVSAGGAATAATSPRRDDDDDDGDGSADEDDAVADGFLTFQHRHRLPAEQRKRRRAEDPRNGGTSSAATAAAAVWLRPPASSSAGTGGDTPGYAIAAERYVYELLREEYAAQTRQDGVRVVWTNEHGEAGAPFDILVLRPRRSTAPGRRRDGGSSSSGSGGGGGGWDVVRYVEVKCTCTADRLDFEMSTAELLYAARFGAAYCVYRVLGASTNALRRMRHRVYGDVVRLWHAAQLTITSDIRVTPST
ncbi:hypothetical protein NESM_000206500 [Novymonas esmeraldas]|uniref:Protein NO VEIN C-terminal domain-containing protein n=1 Tax=Novymonas esmeraldas TaxID=1808958 RepID=A0AAW0F4B9_9TRYP